MAPWGHEADVLDALTVDGKERQFPSRARGSRSERAMKRRRKSVHQKANTKAKRDNYIKTHFLGKSHSTGPLEGKVYDNHGGALKGRAGPGRAGSVSSWVVNALRSQGLEPRRPWLMGLEAPPTPAGRTSAC